MGMRTSTRSDDRDLVQLRHDLRQYVAAGVLLTRLPGDELLDEGTQQRLERLRSLFLGMHELTAAPTVPTGAAWTLDLVQLVDECVSFVRMTHKVPLDLHSDGPATAYGDPVLLRRAVTNVLDNATRAAGESGHVKVRVDSLPGESLVEIADDGEGFGQIPTVTGEGLSIVDKALRACHGRLEISSGPGPGTTVRMLIPVQGGAGDQR
jgi:signal transduction histidine kinase